MHALVESTKARSVTWKADNHLWSRHENNLVNLVNRIVNAAVVPVHIIVG